MNDTDFETDIATGEELLDDQEDFQSQIESIKIDDPELDRLKDSFRKELYGIKVMQVQVDINKHNVKTKLQDEVENVFMQDLPVTKYVELFLTYNQQIDMSRMQEINVFRQFIIDILDCYNEFEEQMRIKNIELESEKAVLIRKRREQKKDPSYKKELIKKALAKYIQSYLKIRKMDEPNMRLKLNLIKDDIKKNLTVNDYIKEQFKKFTGDEIEND